MDSLNRVVISRSPEETRAMAEELVGGLPRRAILALHGDLGSGKTCFVQGLARGLRIEHPVTSPTFTLVNEYSGGQRPLYHIDLYRLQGPDDVLMLGFEDYLEADAVTAIEWAEKAQDLIPPEAIHVCFEALPDADQRRIEIRDGTIR